MKIETQLQKIEQIVRRADRQEANFLCGIPGMGKTAAVLTYCESHPEGLYFSFHHLDATFAPIAFGSRYPHVFGTCADWQAFFNALKIYGKEKRPTVFFDSVGDRQDKDIFYQELSRFMETEDTVCFILIGRPWDNIPIPHKVTAAEAITMPELADVFSLKDEDAAKIISLTAGLPALLSAYDVDQPFEENVRGMLRTDTAFYRLALNWMGNCFRTPETYNTLLYGMTHGYNRIIELSKLSGYPKNKCDKYIKALIEHGLVRKEEGKNGHSKYYPANSYLSLWYGVLFTAIPNADGSFREETCSAFMKYLNDVVLSGFYKDLCRHWIRENINQYTDSVIHCDDLSSYDVKIGNVTFDLVFEDRRKFFICFDCVPGAGLPKQLWTEIEKATTKSRPFYDNEYFLCTVNRVPDSYWTLSKQYDNVHIIQHKSLFTEFKKKYNRRAHPKFVPGFVRRK